MADSDDDTLVDNDHNTMQLVSLPALLWVYTKGSGPLMKYFLKATFIEAKVDCKFNAGVWKLKLSWMHFRCAGDLTRLKICQE